MVKFINLYNNHSDFIDNSPKKNWNISVCHDCGAVHYDEPVWTLRHWLSGEDNLVNSKWVDRISGHTWTPMNSPIHENNYYRLGQKDGHREQYTGALMFFKSDTNFIDLGYYYKFLFNVYIDSSAVYDNDAAAAIPILDLGATRKCQKGIGFHIHRATQALYQNYKMFGNETMIDYPTYCNLRQINYTCPFDEWVTIEFICKKYDNENSIQCVRLNDRPLGLCRSTHPNILMNNLDAVPGAGENNNGIYVLGGCPIKSNNYKYPLKIRIKELKIFSGIYQ